MSTTPTPVPTPELRPVDDVLAAQSADLPARALRQRPRAGAAGMATRERSRAERAAMEEERGSESMGRRLLLGAAGIAGLAALAGRAKAAPPIPPPAGPISHEYKTLQQVFDKIGKGTEETPAQPSCPIEALAGDADAQFVVNMPGRFHLSRNLVQSPTKPICIKVTASDVTICLNDFVVQGSAAIQLSSSCIFVASGVRNLHICDGTFSSTRGRCISGEFCDDMSICELSFVSCTGRPSAISSFDELVVARHRYEMEHVFVSSCSGGFSFGDNGYCDTVAIRDGANTGLRGLIQTEMVSLSLVSCTPMTISTGSFATGWDILILSCAAPSGGALLQCGAGVHIKDGKITRSSAPGGSLVECLSHCTLIDLDIVLDFATNTCARAVRCQDGCCLSGILLADVNGDGCDCGAGCSVDDFQATGCSGTFVVRCATGSCCEDFLCRSCAASSSLPGTTSGVVVLGGCSACGDGQFVGCSGVALRVDDDCDGCDVEFCDNNGQCILAGHRFSCCDCSCKGCTSPSSAITCGDDGDCDCISVCDNTGGGCTAGARFCCDDSIFEGCTGRCISCGDGSGVYCTSFEECDDGALDCGGDSTCDDCDAFHVTTQTDGDAIFRLGPNSCTCELEMSSCGDNVHQNSIMEECDDGNAIDGSSFTECTGIALQCGDQCTATDLTFTHNTGPAMIAGVTFSCDSVVVTGATVALSCEDGATVTACEFTDCPSQTRLGAQCCFTDNRVRNCGGVLVLGGSPVLCSNEIHTTSGPAIVVAVGPTGGPATNAHIEDNVCSSSAPGGGFISVLGDGAAIEANRIVVLGNNPALSIAIQAASFAFVARNVFHLDGAPCQPWPNAIVAGGCSTVGPVSQPGVPSTHPLANTVH